MANKTTVALTREQYEEIIKTMRTGGAGFRANDKIATALILEANLGIRISDILQLTPKSIIKDGHKYRLNIVEKKTGKKRKFKVPKEIKSFINDYCSKYKIKPNEQLFSFKERNVQKYLEKVADYLGYENIGTHSFRKFFATDIYYDNGKNIIIVQRLLQHSSPATTEKYIGVESEEIETAISNHKALL